MKSLRLAAFTSDLPDDQIEDDDDIVQFGGQGVSGVVAQALRDAGYKVEEPEHMGELGWEFLVSGDHRLSLRISNLGDFFTLQSDPGPFLAIRLPQQHFQAAVLRTITDALNRDGRFHDLLWFEAIGEDYGFTDPVIEAPDNLRVRAPIAWNWRSWRESSDPSRRAP